MNDTADVVSRDPPFTEGHSGFTTVPRKTLSEQKGWIFLIFCQKIDNFQERGYLNLTISFLLLLRDKNIKGTVVNWTFTNL